MNIPRPDYRCRILPIHLGGRLQQRLQQGVAAARFAARGTESLVAQDDTEEELRAMGSMSWMLVSSAA